MVSKRRIIAVPARLRYGVRFMTTCTRLLALTAAVALATALTSCGGSEDVTGSPAGSQPAASSDAESPDTEDPDALPADSSEADSSDTSTAAPIVPNALEQELRGRTFVVSDPWNVEGFDMFPDSTITISFVTGPDDAPGLDISGGCNFATGPAVWEGTTVRPAETFSTTEIACADLDEQDQWLSAVLGGGLTLEANDNFLTATGTGPDGAPVTLHLGDKAYLYPDLALVSRVWVLDSVINGTGADGSVTSVPDGTFASLSISAWGDEYRLDASDGRNWLEVPGLINAETGERGGSITIEPADPAVDPAEATTGIVRVTGGLGGFADRCAADPASCPIPEMTLLAGDFAFAGDSDSLTLTGIGDAAELGLIYRPE